MAVPKWLSVFGGIVNKTLQVVGIVQPMVQQFIPASAAPVVTTVSRDLEEVAKVVGFAESFGQALGLDGTQKLTGSSGSVAQIILSSSLIAGHPIANPELFKAGVDKITSGVVDVINSRGTNTLPAPAPVQNPLPLTPQS